MHVQVLPLDVGRATLRITLHVGHFLGDPTVPLMVVGGLLEATAFHVRADCSLVRRGLMSAGCDLVVGEGNAPLFRRRLVELLQLADDFDWYFPLRMPTRLLWQEVQNLELPLDELPRDEAGGFLDEGLKVPAGERTPLILLRVAQGLDRWKDVLRLLREHPDTLPATQHASLKCLALRQLGRWLPAIRAAQSGGIRKGTYPGA